jgi:hypothetical protein
MDDDQLEGLVCDVRLWLEMDNTIRTLQASLRERKEAKRALTSRILEFMASKDIQDFSTRQGDRIAFRVSYVRAPLTQQNIRSRLTDFCASNPPPHAMSSRHVQDVVFGNRERSERATLKRFTGAPPPPSRRGDHTREERVDDGT